MQSNQWGTVTWNKAGERGSGMSKSTHLNKARRTGAAIATSKKYGAGGNTQVGSTLNSKRLDEDMDNLKHAKVSLELRKVLQKERMKAKLSQRELATMINMKPQIIQDYETGKAIPNGMLLQKIERAIRQKNPELVLGTLTKAQKKKPAPKKK